MSQYNKEVLDELNLYIDNLLSRENESNFDFSVRTKIKHTYSTVRLLDAFNFQDNLELYFMKIAMKFHDLGRFPQFRFFGAFNDKVKDHRNIGLEFIEQEIHNGRLKPSIELNKIKNIVLYHGEILDEIDLDNDEKELIELSTVIDDIENGCIGATTYIEHEAENDEKDYQKNNPDLDMTMVSEQVLNFYRNGEKFDKNSYCQTYADYALFAALLAIQQLKSQNRDIAQNCMLQKNSKGLNTIEEYELIFNHLINEKYIDECIGILKGFFENPNYIFENTSSKTL